MAINARNVRVDLRGFEIKGSEEFLLHQRFYSIIQLGKKPFIKTQGPADFGGPWESEVVDVKIHNGILGLSSHYGIHGNNVENVEIYDLVIKDFEVAGIHINGAENVEIRDVIIEDVLDTVPFDSSISHAHFVLDLLNQMDDAQLGSRFPENCATTVLNIRDNLQAELDQALDHGLSPGYDGFFKKQTDSGRPDGSFAAGIVIRGAMDAGVAIGPFAGTNGDDPKPKGKNVRLENININNIVLEPVEWVSLEFAETVGGGPYGGVTGVTGTIKGPFGDVIDPRTWKNTGNFAPTVLSAAQFAACEHDTFGLAHTCSDNSVLSNWFTSDETLQNVLDTHAHTWNCNSDSMMHTMKGAVGMRIEDLEDVTLNNIFINNVHNYGIISADHAVKCAGEQYRGGDAFGMVLGNIGTVINEGEVSMIDIISDSGVAASVALNGVVDDFSFAGHGDHNNWYTDDISSKTLATEFYTCPATGIQFVQISWDQHGSKTSCPFNTCDADAGCSSITYTNIGMGHCVDAINRRPYHCWGWGLDQASCLNHCSASSGCVAYEYGQNYGGILCQLIYLTSPTCPWGMWAAGEGGNSVSKTYHNTGGHCYEKVTARRSLKTKGQRLLLSNTNDFQQERGEEDRRKQ